jgi:hypothetical protein
MWLYEFMIETINFCLFKMPAVTVYDQAASRLTLLPAPILMILNWALHFLIAVRRQTGAISE